MFFSPNRYAFCVTIIVFFFIGASTSCWASPFDDPEEEARQLLQLSPCATHQEIKAAYRKMILQWHPDKHRQTGDAAYAHEITRKIITAYKLLTDALAGFSQPETPSSSSPNAESSPEPTNPEEDDFTSFNPSPPSEPEPVFSEPLPRPDPYLLQPEVIRDILLKTQLEDRKAVCANAIYIPIWNERYTLNLGQRTQKIFTLLETLREYDTESSIDERWSRFQGILQTWWSVAAEVHAFEQTCASASLPENCVKLALARKYVPNAPKLRGL